MGFIIDDPRAERSKSLDEGVSDMRVELRLVIEESLEEDEGSACGCCADICEANFVDQASVIEETGGVVGD